jgi:hypothetical protein
MLRNARGLAPQKQAVGLHLTGRTVPLLWLRTHLKMQGLQLVLLVDLLCKDIRALLVPPSGASSLYYTNVMKPNLYLRIMPRMGCQMMRQTWWTLARRCDHEGAHSKQFLRTATDVASMDHNLALMYKQYII